MSISGIDNGIYIYINLLLSIHTSKKQIHMDRFVFIYLVSYRETAYLLMLDYGD